MLKFIMEKADSALFFGLKRKELHKQRLSDHRISMQKIIG